MKAILIDEFVKDLSTLHPKPTVPPSPQSPSSLQIKISHAALTHVDMLYAQGLHQNNQRHVKPPFILGTEFSGIVMSSPASSSFPPGTRVFGGALGSFAECICVSEEQVRRVPERWSNAEACAVGASGAVSWGALVGVAGLKKGEWVCVFGASGGLGVMAVQIAKSVGARVVAVVAGREKEGVVKSLGVDEVVDYREKGWEGRVWDAVRRRKGEDGEGDGEEGEGGVDVVFDGIGAVESALKCLRYRGRVVVVGFAGRGGKMEGLRVNRVLLKGAVVGGYRFGEDGRRDPRRTTEVWNGFMGLVDRGLIRPVIYEKRYEGLEAVGRALGDLEKRAVWGRAVVRIGEDESAERKGDGKRIEEIEGGRARL
ncbi:zeta-crystallin [Dendryphion nanum]|uniref:Zeta-crystallin n=1 Tax=Dendryphion nanum TaxID=256645 RepID=A0A9P9DWS3_9PLEO|nr:zeta-crystallin [Dendryphion nanum]